jgi:DNA (cytosine-5)-methyltransferase 1
MEADFVVPTVAIYLVYAKIMKTPKPVSRTRPARKAMTKGNDMLQADLFEGVSVPGYSTFNSLCAHLNIEHSGFWSEAFGNALRRWADTTKASEIRTLSLFSGAGGLDIGFHDAGFNITHAVEIDERFAKSLTRNSLPGGYIEGTRVVCEDIRNFSLPNDAKIDFIIGGPPCQTFSAAGRRASGVLGTQDERGTLFQEYVRLLNELQPEGFLFENVYGIVGAEGGKPWMEIQNAFLEAGYRISWRIVDAADYGVAQHRERLLIVGSKSGNFLFPRPTHGPDSLSSNAHVTAKQVLESCKTGPIDNNYQLGGRYGHLLEQIPPGLNYSFFTEELGHPEPIFAWRSKFSDFLYKADPERPVRTLKAQGGQYTGPFHWESRPFTVSELKRLQSFPDAYEIEGSKQVAIHQIGNSVPPQLARIMAMSVLEQLFGVKLPVDLPKLGAEEELGFRKRKRKLTDDYKEKATSAIALLNVAEPQIRTERTYKATLGDTFHFNADEDGELIVRSSSSGDIWTIAIGTDGADFSAIPSLSIDITPDKLRPWSLGSTVVHLRVYGLQMYLFTAVWKAFEAELISHQFKADLVQLSEYYQYAPRFNCRMTIHEPHGWEWEALTRVVGGEGTRRTLHYRELSDLLQIEESKVTTFASFLKDCGYEARSRETNPQIAEDCFLIPYVFPTLSPQSVQLRKKISI